SNVAHPVLQQATFDDLVFTFDILRNVATREEHPLTSEKRSNSLPNMHFTC
ncbi:hypothetical protein LSTR_LSTR015043, partial [Laodelphax striatellus]